MFNSKIYFRSSGFTLIEFLVMFAIVGILSILVMAGSHYAKYYAAKKKVYADLAEITKAVNNLALDCGQWPGHQTPYLPCSSNCVNNEIEDLSTPLAGIKKTDGLYLNWRGPYIQILSKDPWGHNYFLDTDYQINGQAKAVVGSYGPNGRGLNEYDDDDIIYIISR